MSFTKNIFFISLLLGIHTSCIEAKTNEDKTLKSNTVQLAPDFVQEKISETLYILKAKNYNTNVGVFIGEKELLLIDPMAGNNKHQELLNAIDQLSKKPIKYVVNTHSHSDHSGANDFFANRGATIISQENAKYSKARYEVTFKDSYTIEMGNETITLHHSIAHTFDDALVYFKKNNTVFMGDTYMTNSFPHFYYGGGNEGHIKIIDKALSLGNDQTSIIPAHGYLKSNKEALKAYKQNSIRWSSRIKELHALGNSAIEITEDDQIQTLSNIFNNSKSISPQRLQQTIEKTISVDLIGGTILPETVLKRYEGNYVHKNGQVDQIVLSNNTLLFQRENNFIFELVPISETKFHIRGQVPYKHLTMDATGNGFVYFNGNENLKTNKQQ